MTKGARLAVLLVVGASPGAGLSADKAETQTAAGTVQLPYALVTARERQWRVGGGHSCIRAGAGPAICARHPSAWYADARSLAGRPVAPDIGASSRVPAAGWYRPVLLLIRWDADGVPVVVAQAQADAPGPACIPAAELERLGWHPSGPDIAPAAGGACADLSGLAALPLPPMPVVVSISDEELRAAMDRDQRLDRRRRRR